RSAPLSPPHSGDASNAGFAREVRVAAPRRLAAAGRRSRERDVARAGRAPGVTGVGAGAGAGAGAVHRDPLQVLREYRNLAPWNLRSVAAGSGGSRAGTPHPPTTGAPGQ